MNRFRGTLLAAAVTAGIPALVAAQMPPREIQRDGNDRVVREDRGDRQRGEDHARPDRGMPEQAQREDRGRAQQPQAAQAPAAQAQVRIQQVEQQQARQPQQRGAGFVQANDRRGDRGGPDARGGQANRGQDFHGRDLRGRDNRRDGFNGQGFDRGRSSAGGAWRGDWRNDRRYDWRGYRNEHHEIFRAGRYYAPRGWSYGYRRFEIGVLLPSLFYAADYWIDDPAYYRLPPVDGPYRWVRYYDDVLLIDLRSGVVVDSIPGFFLGG